jgi:hypothetical protein
MGGNKAGGGVLGLIAPFEATAARRKTLPEKTHSQSPKFLSISSHIAVQAFYA